MTYDIRWIQRLSNWTRALSQLNKFMEKEDLIEYRQHRLALVNQLYGLCGARNKTMCGPVGPDSQRRLNLFECGYDPWCKKTVPSPHLGSYLNRKNPRRVLMAFRFLLTELKR